MNITQLESFLCIVERGSFASAADTLSTTQSTISARIKELERHFGVALFDRTQHRARLTAKGEEMLPYARQVVQLLQQVSRRISDPNSLDGIVRIGAVGLVAMTLLPGLVMEIRRRYPNVVLKVHVHLARTLLEKLGDGDIDMALITAPVTMSNVETLAIGYDDFVWLACPSLDLPDRILSPKDLEKCPVLGFPEESHHFPIIDKWFSDNNAVYAPAVSCNNMDVLANLTASGAGVTLLPKGCYERLIDQGMLRVLNTRPKIPRVEFVAIYKRDALLHPLINTVATLASQIGNRKAPLSAKASKAGNRWHAGAPSAERRG